MSPSKKSSAIKVNIRKSIFFLFVLAFIILSIIESNEAIVSCNFNTNYTNCPAYGCFKIINSSNGKTLGLIDGKGNFDARRGYGQFVAITPGAGDFYVKNGSGTVTFRINISTGMVHFRGGPSDNQAPPLSPPSGSFIVKNSSGSVVFYVHPSGQAYMLGTFCYDARLG